MASLFTWGIEKGPFVDQWASETLEPREKIYVVFFFYERALPMSFRRVTGLAPNVVSTITAVERSRDKTW